jgi:hypothetical protein
VLTANLSNPKTAKLLIKVEFENLNSLRTEYYFEI